MKSAFERIVLNTVKKATGRLATEDGSLSLKLKPGIHTIEYSPEYFVLGRLTYAFAVKKAEIDIVAGKKTILSLKQEGSSEEDVLLMINIE